MTESSLRSSDHYQRGWNRTPLSLPVSMISAAMAVEAWTEEAGLIHNSIAPSYKDIDPFTPTYLRKTLPRPRLSYKTERNLLIPKTTGTLLIFGCSHPGELLGMVASRVDEVILAKIEEGLAKRQASPGLYILFLSDLPLKSTLVSVMEVKDSKLLSLIKAVWYSAISHAVVNASMDSRIKSIFQYDLPDCTHRIPFLDDNAYPLLKAYGEAQYRLAFQPIAATPIEAAAAQISSEVHPIPPNPEGDDSVQIQENTDPDAAPP